MKARRNWGGVEGEQRGVRDGLQLHSSDVSTAGGEGFGQSTAGMARRQKSLNAGGLRKVGDSSVEATAAFLTQTGSEPEPEIKIQLQSWAVVWEDFSQCSSWGREGVFTPSRYLWVPKAPGRVEVPGISAGKGAGGRSSLLRATGFPVSFQIGLKPRNRSP